MNKQPKPLELANVPISHRNLLWHKDVTLELRRLHQVQLAWREWQEKTEWVQNTAEPQELGMHRADVMRQRLEQAKALYKNNASR